jgi:hypothetical protein
LTPPPERRCYTRQTALFFLQRFGVFLLIESEFEVSGFKPSCSGSKRTNIYSESSGISFLVIILGFEVLPVKLGF